MCPMRVLWRLGWLVVGLIGGQILASLLFWLVYAATPEVFTALGATALGAIWLIGLVVGLAAAWWLTAEP